MKILKYLILPEDCMKKNFKALFGGADIDQLVIFSICIIYQIIDLFIQRTLFDVLLRLIYVNDEIYHCVHQSIFKVETDQ